ncbi:MAG: LysR family substrate-binding domain-containing protein [Lacisediminihabitans sp.]
MDGDQLIRQSADRFRIGVMPGVTVSKWSRAWAERRPDVALEVFRTSAVDQVAALHDGRADVSFVRLPIPHEGLSVIPLYREVLVVVASKDHALAAFESVTLVELSDERIVDAADDLPDAVELVAAGAGVLLVPQSVARSYARRDVVHRPVTDAAETQIALAWLSERSTALIEEFIGIVRGRTARSSRSPAVAAQSPKRRGC